MTCDEIRAQLVALRDEELDAEAAARVREHLARCADCAWLRQELDQVAALADAWQGESADVWPSVRARIALEEDMLSLEAVQALHRELYELRTEIGRLRTDIAELRRQFHTRLAEPARPASRLMFPHVATNDRSRHIL